MSQTLCLSSTGENTTEHALKNLNLFLHLGKGKVEMGKKGEKD